MADQYIPIGGDASLKEHFADLGSNRVARGVSLSTSLSGEDPTNNILRVGGKSSGWSVNHNPGVNTKATISQAAGATGVKNVCTALSWVAATGTTAPAAINLTVNLRDGATGAGTVLKSWTVTLPAAVGYNLPMAFDGLWIEGTAATAMTLEFTAAGGANTFESVEISGVTIS